MSGSINTFEVIGVFHDRAALERATRALEGAGIGRSRLSLLGTPEAAEAGLGLPMRELEASPGRAAAEVTRKEGPDKRDGARDVAGLVGGVPTYVGAALAAGAVAASGGALAPVRRRPWPAPRAGAPRAAPWPACSPTIPRPALSYEEELRDGGVLLFVALEHAGHVGEAKRVLEEHGARSVKTQVVTD
jgi:hypothetical protein